MYQIKLNLFRKAGRSCFFFTLSSKLSTSTVTESHVSNEISIIIASTTVISASIHFKFVKSNRISSNLLTLVTIDTNWKLSKVMHSYVEFIFLGSFKLYKVNLDTSIYTIYLYQFFVFYSSSNFKIEFHFRIAINLFFLYN